MSYRLNKTDGELIVELADGQIDNSSTDLTLIGRNYRGFGELFNENFIKLLENFSSSAPPDNPLVGQLWYDTSEERLRVFNGISFRTAGSPIVAPDKPVLVEGDLWIDTREKKLYFYDGNAAGNITLVGPQYSSIQGKSGFETISVIDDDSIQRTVLKLFVGGNLVGVISESNFTLSGSQKIEDFPDSTNESPTLQIIEEGFNLVNENFLYRGTASAALALKSLDGTVIDADSILVSDQSSVTSGSLTIDNTNGLTISSQGIDRATYKTIGTTSTIEMQQSRTDFVIRTKIDNSNENALYIDSSERNIGIYNIDPEYTLDVTGDIRSSGDAIINGNLTVNGTASFINSDQVRILDKNIELGWLQNDDSSLTEGTDSQVDDAGITVVSKNGSKDFSWKQSTDSWTSNKDLDLIAGKVFRINGNEVLSSNRLSPSVKTATGLNRIGTLENLTVDNININDNTISTPQNSTFVDLVLNPSPGKHINVSSSKIKNLQEPTDNADASTKQYVDARIDSQPVVLALDITGLANVDNDVRAILDAVSPAAEKRNGTRARIVGTSYENISIENIDVSSNLDKTYASITDVENPIDLEDNIELTAKSVIQDFSLGDTSVTYTPSPDRYILDYIVQEGTWVHLSTNFYNI